MATPVENLAFTEDNVLRLVSGLTRWKLRHWVASGVVTPSFGDTFAKRGPRLFSFQDVVELRVLARLRQVRGLQTLREVGVYLREFAARPWSSLRLYATDKGGVLFKDPKSGRVLRAVGPRRGQVVETSFVDLEDVTHATREDVVRVRLRSKDDVGRIHKKRGVAGGNAVIQGTRVPVWVIKSWKDAGHDVERIRKEYPSLTVEDIKAALAHDEPPRRKRTG